MKIMKELIIAGVGLLIADVESTQSTLYQFLPAPTHPTVQRQIIANELDVWGKMSFVEGYGEVSADIISRVLKYYDNNSYTEGLPHLAILKIMGNNPAQASVCKILFLSGLKSEKSIERLQAKMGEISLVKNVKCY